MPGWLEERLFDQRIVMVRGPLTQQAATGIAAALLTLEALGDRDLAERDAMEKLPQALASVRVRDRSAVDGAVRLWEAVERENQALAGRGRVLVRPSGTEPVVRVMVEAPSQEECDAALGRLVAVAEQELS